MHPENFSKNSPGKLVKTPQGYWAFLPDALPPLITPTWELVHQNSEAERALSELAGVARTLPNPHLLSNAFVPREAVLSSRIEGTRTSLPDLFYFEAEGTSKLPTFDLLEVVNYRKALEYGLTRLESLPVSLRLIREIHERLMAGTRGGHLTPGEFRRSQNWIGPPGCTLMDATFVPPPEAEMHLTLGELEMYLHTPSYIPPIIRLALIHYQFESIHPFLDGNGRVGRLLVTLLFCAEGLLTQPLLYLSAFFERHQQEYYRLLLAVSQQGAWSEWIAFFLRGVADQSRDGVKRASRLLNLWNEYRERLQSTRTSILMLRLVDLLFANPVTTVKVAANRLHVTQKAIRLNIEKLVDENILREVTGQQRNRVFLASAIMDIMEAPEA
jgi:Fic family protein